jgi:aldose 1-epimerase
LTNTPGDFTPPFSKKNNKKTLKNLVLNFPTADLYQQHNLPYFGETIGRVANRISGAKLNRLNDQEYRLPENDAPRKVCLHGGKLGWGKKVWDGPKAVTRSGASSEVSQYELVSEHLDEGFPGKVRARVWYDQKYEFANVGQGGKEMAAVSVLDIEYEAELIGNEVDETAVAMTNHR